jgi:hypothetical protein
MARWNILAILWTVGYMPFVADNPSNMYDLVAIKASQGSLMPSKNMLA